MVRHFKQLSTKSLKGLPRYLVIAILFTLLGLYLGAHFQTEKAEKQVQSPEIGPKSLIKSQQAIAVGKIIKFDNDTLSVQGDDGSTLNFKLSPQINIYKTPAASTSAGLPSKNRSDIQLNKKAIINLSYQNDGYTVGTITYLSTMAR
jgi:hypothetical protein